MRGYFQNGKNGDWIVHAIFAYHSINWRQPSERIKEIKDVTDEAAWSMSIPFIHFSGHYLNTHDTKKPLPDTLFWLIFIERLGDKQDLLVVLS
jgi:hypothetical protein